MKLAVGVFAVDEVRAFRRTPVAFNFLVTGRGKAQFEIVGLQDISLVEKVHLATILLHNDACDRRTCVNAKLIRTRGQREKRSNACEFASVHHYFTAHLGFLFAFLKADDLPRITSGF